MTTLCKYMYIIFFFCSVLRLIKKKIKKNVINPSVSVAPETATGRLECSSLHVGPIYQLLLISQFESHNFIY